MSPEGTERRLAAVLMADVVGYSRLMAEDESATVQTLTTYRHAISDLVSDHRGRVVDTAGDSLLAEFRTARDAVECAVEIQRVLKAAQRRSLRGPADGVPHRRPPGTRVAAKEERLYGDGVNIAARMQALADPGGVCLSGTAYDLVHTKLGVGFDDLGAKSVKNIPDPVRVYRVKLEAAPSKAAPGSLRRTALAVGVVVLLGAIIVAGWWRVAERVDGLAAIAPGQIRSLAVLPLENLSGDPEQEYFADGMTKALIGELGRISARREISRTSLMQYKGHAEATTRESAGGTV